MCINPYLSAPPVTINTDTGKQYGHEFSPTTIRADVGYVICIIFIFWILIKRSIDRIHELVLDHLGVRSVAVVSEDPWEGWLFQNGLYGHPRDTYGVLYLLQNLRVILFGVSVGVKPNDKAYTAIQAIKMVSTLHIPLLDWQQPEWVPCWLIFRETPSKVASVVNHKRTIFWMTH